MDSLEKVKEKTILMNHLPSEVNLASKLYLGYLSEEELYKGRFWTISAGHLLILVDNETLADIDGKGNTCNARRDAVSLPVNLVGRYYDEY